MQEQISSTIYINTTLFVNTPARSHYHGIIRVEVELLRFLTKNYPGKFHYFAFECSQNGEAKYFTIQENYLINKLAVFEKDYSTAKGVTKKIKRILFKIFPDEWIVKLNDIYNNVRSKSSKPLANEENLARNAVLEFPEGASILSVGADFMQNEMMADLARKKTFLNLKILLIGHRFLTLRDY